jgi:methionyl-tRNA formyltransferase
VKLFDAAFKPLAHDAAPGEILEVTSHGLTIAVQGGALVIGRVRTKDLGKMKIQEFIQARSPQVGETFGD